MTEMNNMLPIPFPTQYKKALLKKSKNTTLRIKDEIGKYEVGKVYLAESYAGSLWNIKIEITDIIATSVDNLSEFGIPERSVSAMLRREGISRDEKVEIVRFRVL